MLELDSPRWAELEHAYGSAKDIPGLLRQLKDMPSSENDNEPWFSIWSSLAHQGDVYSASFAAVPHVVSALKQAPSKADFTFFQFPAWIEICRKKNSIDIPEDLAESYFRALAHLPAIVAAAAESEWDSNFLCCALSAIAASKGFHAIAEAVQEIDSEVAEEFMEWFYDR